MTVRDSLPEPVRQQVERDVGSYCEKVPPHVRDKVRNEFEIRGNSVTIFECRPPWREDAGPEWTRVKVAQFRYEDGNWVLYWSDRNGRWHTYDLLAPTPELSDVLAEVDRDQTGIFWG
jgi:hypothetical protein